MPLTQSKSWVFNVVSVCQHFNFLQKRPQSLLPAASCLSGSDSLSVAFFSRMKTALLFSCFQLTPEPLTASLPVCLLFLVLIVFPLCSFSQDSRNHPDTCKIVNQYVTSTKKKAKTTKQSTGETLIASVALRFHSLSFSCLLELCNVCAHRHTFITTTVVVLSSPQSQNTT